MMNEFLFPKIRRRYFDLATSWFQLDEAAVLNYSAVDVNLKNMAEHCIISCYGEISWPASLPDFSVCGLLLLGFLESKVLEIRPADLHNLNQGICDEINNIPPGMSFCEIDFF
jgi:hypothetical protein